MIETTDFMLISVDELTEINGGSTKIIAAISGLGAIGFGIAAAVTGSTWCGAAAATCGLVFAWNAFAPCI